MRKLVSAFVIPALLLAWSSLSLAHGENPELQWETANFKNPESVVYDRARDLLYVSNVNGEPTAKDGNGFISTVSMSGEIQNLKWITGLDAPKGLAIYKNKLYIADIDTLVEIDITSSEVSNRYDVADAKFLNDVAAAEDGHIYVSDMVLDRIYRLHDGKFELWLEDTALENPNGLLVHKGRLVVGSWGVMKDGFRTETPGHLKVVSFDDKSISSIGEGKPTGNLDGIEADLDGDYYVTDWMAGKLLHIDQDGNSEVLLDLGQGSADLEFIADQDLLLIPMMNDNKLLAYKAHGSADDK